MAHVGRKFRAAAATIDRLKPHTTREAVEKVKSAAFAKFDESVDVALNLGVDPKHADQIVRGTVVLPHGVGKKVRVLVFARPVAGRPTQLQLVAKDAQRRWSPAAEALTRRIAQETVQPNQPPEITGIANAFHVAGSLPGEGETQIFLTTRDNRPVSLDILRRPGEQPRWSVALSDVTDAAAQAPERDTLLWYRLACFLPPDLPESSVNASDPSDVAKAREDYRFVLQSLGPCDTRKAY